MSTTRPLAVAVLIPAAMSVLVPLVLVLVGAAAGGFDVVKPLGGELLLLPHAARPTTAAAARTEAANHRLRIVSSPFATVTPLRVHTRHVRYARLVQAAFRSVSGGDPLAEPGQRER